MRTNKIITTIIIETLSLDSVCTMLNKAYGELYNHTVEGKLVCDDGDTISWEVTHKDVEF